MPGWTDATDCSKKVITCHVSCAGCTGEAQNECDACYDGFVLQNGFCLPCHEDCVTCNGTEENNCVTCFQGETPVAGVCTCCHATCASCNGIADNQCTGCFADATPDGNGRCICNAGKVRSPATFGCVDACPFGYVADSHKQCVRDTSVRADLNLDFTNGGSGSAVDFAYCRNPDVNQNTFTFNDDNQSIHPSGLVMSDSVSVEFWGSFGDSAGYIISAEHSIWDYKHAFANIDETCHYDPTIPRNRVRAGVQLDSCFRANVQYRLDNEQNVVFKTDEQFNRGWVHIFYSMKSDVSTGHITYTLQHSTLSGGYNTIDLTLENFTAYIDEEM
jgi:hypothetical protein